MASCKFKWNGSIHENERKNAILLRKSQNLSDKKENTIQHHTPQHHTSHSYLLWSVPQCCTNTCIHNYVIFFFISFFFSLFLSLSLGFVWRKPCCCYVFFVMIFFFFYSHGHKSKDDHLWGIKVHVTDVTYFTRHISLKPTTGQKVSIFSQEVSRPSKINNCDSEQ